MHSLDAKNKTAAFWNFDSTNKTTLFRTKGLKDDGCGRFQTSTKPWLDGYDTVREKRHPSLGSTRMNSTVGQAMFNLKRSLPPPSQHDANKYIRLNNNKANLMRMTKQNSPSISNSNQNSPKRFNSLYSSR